MTKEIGTLKELDLKPGDVVECIYVKFATWKVGERYTMTADGLECEYEVPQKSSVFSKFRIISRASDTPKLWCDMSDEEKLELLLAEHEGKVMQFYHEASREWVDDLNFNPVMHSKVAHRIKPEPKRETVGLYAGTNHIGTIDLINGKPDWDSIKMEEF